MLVLFWFCLKKNFKKEIRFSKFHIYNLGNYIEHCFIKILILIYLYLLFFALYQSFDFITPFWPLFVYKITSDFVK